MSNQSVTSVVCNHCGAPLEMQADTRFMTCTYCGAKLQVHRSPTSIYTEVLESLDQRTQQMAQDLDVIKRQNELERLDREWMMQRESMMITGKNGQRSEPSIVGGVFAIIVGVVFGGTWLSIAGANGAPAFMLLFGLVFMAAAVIGGISSITKAAAFKSANQDYRLRREAMQRQPDEQ